MFYFPLLSFFYGNIKYKPKRTPCQPWIHPSFASKTEAHCARCAGPQILEDSGARPAARPRRPAPLRRPGVANIDPKKTGPKKTPRRLHRLGTLHLCHMAPRGQLMHLLANNLGTMMTCKSTPGDFRSFRLRPFPQRPTSARSA